MEPCQLAILLTLPGLVWMAFQIQLVNKIDFFFFFSNKSFKLSFQSELYYIRLPKYGKLKGSSNVSLTLPAPPLLPKIS